MGRWLKATAKFLQFHTPILQCLIPVPPILSNPFVFTADTVLPGVKMNTVVIGNSYWTVTQVVKDRDKEIKDQDFHMNCILCFVIIGNPMFLLKNSD